MIDNEIVTANARTFPLINSTSEDRRTLITRDSEQGMNDPVIARQIDALTPYVDLARMARERYDRSPSIQNGARMGEKVGVLKTRITNLMQAIPMRESDLLKLVRQKFPNIDRICSGEGKEAGND